VVARNVQMLGSRSGSERGPDDAPAMVPPDDVPSEFGNGPDDDIPF
jgi:hypothetical protein